METREQRRLRMLERAINEGEVIIGEGRIVYKNAKGSNNQNYLDPEEKVRALVYSELIYYYEYKSSNMYIERPVPLHNNKYADIVIFDDKDENKIYAVIECKKETVKKREIHKAIYEQYDYAIVLDAKYFVFDCNITKERKVFMTRYIKDGKEERWGAKERSKNVAHDLPIRYGEKKEWIYIKNDKEHRLEPVSNIELLELFRKCHDILWAHGEKDPAEAFDEMSKLIFLKTYDEVYTPNNQPYFFQIGNHEIGDKLVVSNRIRERFEKAKATKEHVFVEDIIEDNDGSKNKIPATIKTDSNRLYKVVSLLQHVDFYNTDLDAKGRAFEQFLDTVFKSKLGQYFTHRNIVNFCVHAMEPTENDIIIDPSCGSGGFLLYSLVYVRDILEKDYDLDNPQQFHSWKGRTDNFIRNSLFGIEKNEKIARVAMMDMVIYEDGSTNIENNDGLTDYSNFKIEELKNGCGQFSLILSNPPFGAKIKSDEDDGILENFVLGKERNTQASDVLFIERNIDLLQPNFNNKYSNEEGKKGGRMAIIIPDGILNNSSLWYVRQYIEENCRILGVISLPDFAFKQTGSGSKTSILFLQKFTLSEKRELEHEKARYLKQKEKIHENMRIELEQNLNNFIKENEIEKILGDIYNDVLPLWSEVDENIKIEIKEEVVVEDNGKVKTYNKDVIASDLDDDQINDFIIAISELFNEINKVDYDYGRYEDNKEQVLIKYVDDLNVLYFNINKFLEPSIDILIRQYNKTNLQINKLNNIKNIIDTLNNIENIDVDRNKLEKSMNKFVENIDLDSKDDLELKLRYFKGLEVELTPVVMGNLKLLKQQVHKYNYRINIEDYKEIRNFINDLKGIKKESKYYKTIGSSINPLWISTKSQINNKNTIGFFKYLGFDILKQYQSYIRMLEIQQDDIDNYIPDYEAHKQVLEDKKYPIFMAIVDNIGYDATGRPDKNQLYKEMYVKKEDGSYDKFIDDLDENTVLGQWKKFKKRNNIIF